MCWIYVDFYIAYIILFIDSNEIGVEGTKAIGAALINNSTLTNLDLCMCSFFCLLCLLYYYSQVTMELVLKEQKLLEML